MRRCYLTWSRKLREVRSLTQCLDILFIVLTCRRKLRFQQMQNEMLVDVNFSCKNDVGCGQRGCYEVSELCMFFWSPPPDRNMITTAARCGRSSSERLCCRSSSRTCCSSSRRPARLWVSNTTSHISTLWGLLHIYLMLTLLSCTTFELWPNLKAKMCVVGCYQCSFEVFLLSISIMIISNQEDWWLIHAVKIKIFMFKFRKTSDGM